MDISKKSKDKDIAALLNIALDDPDLDENVSIRGIEHFVYPDLQQEMIRRKKEQQREVLEFARSPRPDPQGWRLADHSRYFSLWARTVAVEKAMKYRVNNAAVDPEGGTISKDELERMQRSGDELEWGSTSTTTQRMRRGSSILSLVMSQSYEGDERQCPSNSSQGGILAEGNEDGNETNSRNYSLSQSASYSPKTNSNTDLEQASVFHEIAKAEITWECEKKGDLENRLEGSSQPAGSDTGED